MKLVLNNESLLGQYETEEEFLDSLASNMIPCLKLAKDKKLGVLTIYSIYEKSVYFGKTLGNILSVEEFFSDKIKGLNEFTVLGFDGDKLFFDEGYYSIRTKETHFYPAPETEFCVIQGAHFP